MFFVWPSLLCALSLVPGEKMLWPRAIVPILLLSSSSTIWAFHSPSSAETGFRIRRIDTSLDGGGLFGLGRSGGDNNNNNNVDDENDAASSSSSRSSSDDVAISVPADERLVLEIPVISIKRGGLRFVLGLHLVGLDDAGTWSPNQSSEYSLDAYFGDGSGMFRLIFDDDAIRVYRRGSRPSLAYLLQESVALHGILDELSSLCFDGSIESGNRLLRLDEPGDAIDRARATLPARKA
jgi:hypothetical protein